MNCSDDDDEVEFLGTTTNNNNVTNKSNNHRTAKPKTTNSSNDYVGLAEYRAEASLKYHQQQKQKSNNSDRTNKDNVIDVDAIDFSSSKCLSSSSRLSSVPSSIKNIFLQILDIHLIRFYLKSGQILSDIIWWDSTTLTRF